MTVLVVTGTDTGVGKTVVTAATVAAAGAAGRRVCMVKPVQTGMAPGGEGDAAVVSHLSGCRDVHELVRLADALAPDTAARLRGLAVPTVTELADRVRALAADHDVVVAEGAGGAVVRLDTAGGTILGLARQLVDDGEDVRVVIVTRLSLGTLNHTELAVGAVLAVGLVPRGLVVGSAAADGGLAERCNVEELPRVTGVPLLGVIPSGAGRWEPEVFRREAVSWLDWSVLLGA